jgi:PfaB family protein
MKTNYSGANGPAEEISLAIAGMDILSAQWDGLAAFTFALYQGQMLDPQARISPAHKLSTSELEFFAPEVTLDLKLEELLLMKVSARAALAAGSRSAKSCGWIFLAGNRLAAATLGKNGDAFSGAPQSAGFQQAQEAFGLFSDFSLKGNPLAAAFSQAQQWLAQGSVEAVVIAAASLHVDFDALIQQDQARFNQGSHSFGLENGASGWSCGEASTAIVLTSTEFAAARQLPIYASLNAMGYAERQVANPKQQYLPTFVSSETIYQSCSQAFALSGITSSNVGYLETLASGFTPLDVAEITGLTKAYGGQNGNLSTAINSAQTNLGYLFSAAGLAGVIKAALCLKQRIIPPITGWSAPKKPELWDNTPFYAAGEARTWFQPRSHGSRIAAINSIGWDGSCSHLLLAEAQSPNLEITPIRTQFPAKLFLVGSNSIESLAAELTKLESRLTAEFDPGAEARDAYRQYRQFPQPRYTAALTGMSTEEIRREVSLAKRDIPAAVEKNKAWQTPAGSSFTPNPVGGQGDVAFVYPGAFNSYIGLGRDLFTLFPDVYQKLTAISADLGTTLQDQKLYPRSLKALSKERLAELESKLTEDPIALITSGSLLAVFYTLLLRDVFKVRAAAAFGYSLGEIGMLFANGIWDRADEVRAGLQSSALFRERIAGPQNAVREAWGLPTRQGTGAPIWVNYFLMAPAESVRKAIEMEERVYLTHVNTPRQVVIGGEPAACQRLIASLKCNSLRAPFDFALHCAAMQSEFNPLANMLTWPVAVQPATRLYTAAGFEPLDLDSQHIAQKIARMLCSSLDFPSLARKVNQDGVKIFIELGANANCSKWIDDTLKDQEILSVAINRKGIDDHTSLVRMLSKLASHQVPMDLSPLFD